MTDTEKRTDFDVTRTAIVDDGAVRYVEVDFYSALATADPPTQYIRVRLAIEQEDFARIEEAHLEALRIARNAIGDETARLTRSIDQAR